MHSFAYALWSVTQQNGANPKQKMLLKSISLKPLTTTKVTKKISTEVDTLQDLWLAHPEIISFAEKLCTVEDNLNTVDEGCAQLNSRINTIHRKIYRGYSSLELLQLLGNASDLRTQIEQFAERKLFLDSIHARLSDDINAMVSSLETSKDPY